MKEEAAFQSIAGDRPPCSTAAGISFIEAFPRQLNCGGIVAAGHSIVDRATDGAELERAEPAGVERYVRRYFQVEEVLIPEFHFDDAPDAGDARV